MGPTPRSTVVEAPTAEKASKAQRPILPFFSVLLQGRDAEWGWGTADGAEPVRHPTVGYVQVIYFAIALNWVVDFAGMTYMFHTYLVSWSAPVVRWGIPMVLATVFSTGFASFAVSLVQKPLRRPRIPRSSPWAMIAGFATLVSCLAVILATWAFDDLASPWFTFAAFLAWSWLGLAAMIAFFVAFGTMDALYVSSRGVVMVFVGYLVADPLHEAMFEKEIEDSFYQERVARVQAALEKLEEVNAEGLKKHKEATEICTKRYTKTEVQSCADMEKSVHLLELQIRSYNALMDDEYRGSVDEERRDKIRADAKAYALEGELDMLNERPKSPHVGKRWRAYEEARNRASDLLKVAMGSLGVCQKDSRQPVVNEDEKKACIEKLEVEEGESRTSRMKEMSKLLAERARLENREEAMGAIDRALALRDLIEHASSRRDDDADDERGNTANDQERGSVEGATDTSKAEAVVERKLVAAWFMALVMPLIVVTMKLTGGARLEPYLGQRWQDSEGGAKPLT
jgi:hypothetical protein